MLRMLTLTLIVFNIIVRTPCTLFKASTYARVTGYFLTELFYFTDFCLYERYIANRSAIVKNHIITLQL